LYKHRTVSAAEQTQKEKKKGASALFWLLSTFTSLAGKPDANSIMKSALGCTWDLSLAHGRQKHFFPGGANSKFFQGWPKGFFQGGGQQ